MMRTLTFLLLTLSCFSLMAQDDDVYYSPKHDGALAENTAPEQKTVAQHYDYEDGEIYSDYNDDYYSESESQTDASGNTYITNNYYGDYYESDYTTKLRRYYSPYKGFGYYSPCYSGYYYDPYYNYGYGGGWSVSVSWGFGWGYPSYGGYYNPWYYPYYNPYYSNYGYGGYYGNSYWNGYNHGFHDGYWNGYNDGNYGYGGYSGYDDNYHYGPRYKTQGTSAYRNTYAEKKAPEYEVVEKRSNEINTFPVEENKDVMTPVTVGDPSQLSNKPDKNDGKSTDNGRIQNNPMLNNGEAMPVKNVEVKTQKPDVLDKGEVKPINTQRDPRTNAVDKYEVKTPDAQRGNTTNPSEKPEINVPRNQPPVNRERPAPNTNYNQKPNTERQESPKYNENYQKPQEGGYYRPKVSTNEKNDQIQATPKSKDIQRNDEKPQLENKIKTPLEQPSRNKNTPKNSTKPARDVSPKQEVSPKSFDKGGSIQRSEPRSGGVSPAPSNRGSQGGSLPSNQGPQQGGRTNPR